MQPFIGPATVFTSHCWGGRWGDLVAAVCAGADKRRVVWIDIFAVRQWPGNGADLDFRGVIQRSMATVVAVAPYIGTLTNQQFRNTAEIAAFMASDEFGEAAKVLAFCRLWCLVEIYSTMDKCKGLVFRIAKFLSVGESRQVMLAGGKEEHEERGVSSWRSMMLLMLGNCSFVIDVGNAACAVPADREREMELIERETADKGGLNFVNKTVSSGVVAGGLSLKTNTPSLDNFVCGERDALRKLPASEVRSVLHVACAAGEVEFLGALHERLGGTVLRVLSEDYYPLWIAAYNGHIDVVRWLLEIGAMDVNRADDNGATPLYIASQKDHPAVVSALIESGADINMGPGNKTPLAIATKMKNAQVMEVLEANGAKVRVKRTEGGCEQS